jgi:hypothetical protein
MESRTVLLTTKKTNFHEELVCHMRGTQSRSSVDWGLLTGTQAHAVVPRCRKALGGHFKTGQRNEPETMMFLLVRFLIRQVHFGSPTPGPHLSTWP